MPTAEDYRRRAELEEAEADRLPDGFERADRLRRAAAWRDLADSAYLQSREPSGEADR